MDYDTFKQSLKNKQPPPELSDALVALWWDAKGDWSKAHETAQDVQDKDGAWVHAYLHRKEGNLGNSSYWYHRADKRVSSRSLPEEWEDIVKNLIKNL